MFTTSIFANQTSFEIIDHTGDLRIKSVRVTAIATRGGYLFGCKTWDFHHGSRYSTVYRELDIKDLSTLVIENNFEVCKYKIKEIEIDMIDKKYGDTYYSNPRLYLQVNKESDNQTLNYFCKRKAFRGNLIYKCLKDSDGNFNDVEVNLNGENKTIVIAPIFES